MRKGNIPYIAAACNLAPALAREVEALRAQLAKQQELIDAAQGEPVTLSNVLLADAYAAEIDGLKAQLATEREWAKHGVKNLPIQGPPASYCMSRSELHCERVSCSECKKEWAAAEAAKEER